jgi:hypothetical protein
MSRALAVSASLAMLVTAVAHSQNVGPGASACRRSQGRFHAKRSRPANRHRFDPRPAVRQNQRGGLAVTDRDRPRN